MRNRRLTLSFKAERLKRTIPALISLFLSLPLAAAADIYQYVDGNGVLHFSNTGTVKKAKVFARESLRTAPKEPAAEEEARPAGKTTPSLSIIHSSYSDIIHDACDKHGVDPALVHAIVKVESDFNVYAVSRTGAMGLMQLMPQTAVEMNVRNSFNPTENIYGGVKYLRYLLDRYEGNLKLALAAYNSGETSVKRWGTIPPFRETQQYVRKVLQIYNGTADKPRPRYTIYMGYSNDGTILLTDNPSNHPSKTFTRKAAKNL